MLEREVMKKWIAARAKTHPRDYWLRIPDSSDGIKPFDGILFCETGTSFAIEFKVWRKKKPFDYSTVEPHQMRELLRFEQGKDRIGLIVVFNAHTKKTEKYRPSRKVLNRLLKGEL
jgi:hypothetical protein